MRMDHVEGPLYILLVEKEGHPYPTRYMSSFSFFQTLYEFYIGEEEKKSMMDHLDRRGGFLLHCHYIGICM